MAEDEKRFLGIWGSFENTLSDYEETMQEITLADINAENGYELTDILHIKLMARHQVWYDYEGGNHYIIRIK